MQPYIEVWTAAIWPTINDIFAGLFEERPARQSHRFWTVLQNAADEGEFRNISAKLTWTDPTENTTMQLHISFEAVAQWTLDMYTDTKAVDVEDPDSRLA